ncbi:MAG: FHA domain-containing protein [Bacteroidetes bacterium]|jgi:predicted component of type VI protein secretion system|nr:FHA domain-containing protein [Bacteroidota bacterium]
MTFKLFVSRTSEDQAAEVYRFEEEVVQIGRGAGNDLQLTDDTRVVSTRHAEIRAEEGGCQVVDLNSKNFTYLNGERLRPQQGYPLTPGAVLRMGDFELQFQPEQPAVAAARGADDERTVFAASFENPFEDDAAVLAAAVERMRAAYADEAPSRRADALRDALTTAFDEAPGSHALDGVLAAVLGAGNVPAAAAASGAVAAPMAASTPKPEPAPAPPSPPPKQPPAPRAVPSTEGASASRIDLLIDTLLRVVARMAEVPWRFRHEFIGQTIMQSEEAAFIYSGDADALRGHLLNPTVPDQAARHRLQLLEDALEDLLVHQLALLDGYKASVQKGMHRFLEDVDPAPVAQELAEESALYRFLAVLAQARAAETIIERCETLRQEDWAVVERRIFRPAFIKAYLARMTAAD